MPVAKRWEDLRGAIGRFVIALEWYRDGTLYWSDRAFELSSDAGTLLVSDGLADLTLGRSEPSPEVRIVIDSDRLDWLEPLRRGLIPSRIPARLYRWHTGDTFEDMRLLVDGFLVDVSLADPSAPNRLSAVLRPIDLVLGRLIPSVILTKESIPQVPNIVNNGVEADSPAIGMYRPEVFGRPGAPNGRAAMPMLELTLTDNTLADFKSPAWLLCGHLIGSSNVYIWDAGNGLVTAIEPVQSYTDEQGRRWSGVAKTTNPFSGFPSADERVNSGREFFWGIATGEGRANPYRPGDLRGLSDVLRYLYEFVGNRRIDQGRMEAFAAELNQYAIDAVLTEPVQIEEWIEGEILRVYPVRIIEGPDGLYCRRRSYRATPAEAVATLSTVGQGILVTAASPLTPVSVTEANHVRVEYGFERLANYSKAVEVGVTPGDSALTTTTGSLREGGSHLAEIGHSFSGRIEAVLEVPTTWDTSTAHRLALDYLDRETLPRFRRLYEGGIELEGLAIGDVVQIDDSALDPNQILLGTIEEIQTGRSVVRVTVELLRDPLMYDVPTT